MTRVILACLLSLLVTAASAQAPAPNGTPVASPVKPGAKTPAMKPKVSAKQTTSINSGRCDVGVIAATENLFTVRQVGLTVFGNDEAEVPVSWGLDDLIFARARAAAGSAAVRRIASPKGAFDSFYHPQSILFSHQRDELTNSVKRIAGNAGCDCSLLILRGEAELGGTNQMLPGVGILRRGIPKHAYLFAYLRVIMFDGRTWEMQKNPNATFENALKRLATLKVEDLRKVDDSMFPAAPTDAAGNAELRDKTREFLAERLDSFLPSFFQK
jgi:hypothetical protein